MAVRQSAILGQPSICLTCDKLPYWSNTDDSNQQCAEDVGSETATNRDTLNKTAPIVSAFRCGSPTPKNVWMKDAWEDTGAEPDSNTSGMDMWKSPYVWVRNAQDPGPTFIEQHHHQNPGPGTVNFIYTKLHNGGDVTSGTLEVWEASASTGLSWQADFKKIGDVPVAGFQAHSTRIFELPWTPEQVR